ncbi:MAG: hypothetical protein M1383_02595 [Patescibacteria group bacterium]|nr:hypothetical protein [Patescibacteria group bacterium]
MQQAWKTFGHGPAKSILEKQLLSGKLPHAYMMLGPDGVGKKTLALEFAAKILNAEKPESHADFQMLDVEGEITMDLAKEFISRLGFKPFLGERKVAIINNAQNLNLQSSNALLKTLEEPSASTVIILIARERMLPTIISRCQVLHFNLFTCGQLEDFAKSRNLSADREKIELSFGSPARLLKLAQDPDFAGRQLENISQIKRLKAAPLAEKLLTIGKLADLEERDLRQVLENWHYWQAGQLKGHPKEYKISSALAEALRQLATNKNRKMLLQGLFMKI